MSKKIMIIDDAASVRQAVGATLQEAGYEIIEATNGKDALSKLNGLSVDMFICDVNMPVMDGVTCLNKLKYDAAYKAYRFTPFIMLTTEAGSEMKSRGKYAGAKAWIVKPFQPTELLCAVKKLLL